MADEKKELEPIDTTGTTRMRPVPLKFGGVKAPEKKKSWLPRPGGKDHPGNSDTEIPGLELESPRKIIRQGMIVVGLFFGILGVWSFFGTISGAVVAPGRIKIETERKIVQHLEGGIVDEILVHEGEEVKEGQPLIVLESVRIDADATALEKELVALEAQKIRFEAEKDGKTSLSWPEELKQLAKNSANMDVLASEERIFASRQESQATQVSLLLAQIKQLNAQIGGYQDELKAEQKIISTLREELAAKRQLFKNRYVEKSQILGLERDLAGHEGSAGKLRQSIAGEASLAKAIINLRQIKSTVIMVTHKPQILNIVDNIMVMQDGQVAMCGARNVILGQLAKMQAEQRAKAQQAAREAQIAKERLEEQRNKLSSQQDETPPPAPKNDGKDGETIDAETV